MTDTLSYYQTGRFLQFTRDITLAHDTHIVGDRFVTITIENESLALTSIPLPSEGGLLVSPEDNKVIIPLTMRYLHMASRAYEDKLLVTLFNVNPRESLIVVIHLDRENQGFIYQQYGGPDFQSSPMGLDGNTIYLLHRAGGRATITGFNLETGQTEFRYSPGNAIFSALGKMQDGTLVFAILRRGNAPDSPYVTRIVSIPDEEAILDIEGDVTFLFPIETGVLYQVDNGEIYFCTYDGVQYRTNIGVTDTLFRIAPVAVSNNADDERL